MNNRHDAARRLALVSTVSVIALSVGAASAQETTAIGDGARWSAHGSLTARAGTERHIGELDLFLPLWQSDSSMLYGDLRAQTDDAGNQEGNVGLGFRTMGEDWIVGGYGFFDYRKSDETGNTFNQGTLGLEALSESLDLRANFYVPENGEQAAPGMTALQVIGGSLQLRQGAERALPGVDGEIGYRLWNSEDGDREVRAFAGGYYFDAADYSTVAGGRGRIEARLFDLDFLGEGSRFTLGAEVMQDNVRDTQGFATARLTIPFGGGRRSGQGGLDRRMADYVVRDVDIITRAETVGSSEAVAYADSGVTVGNVMVLTNDDNIVAAAASGSTGDLFVVDGSVGPYRIAESIVLAPGVVLLGGGASFNVVGVDSGQQLTYTAVGTLPVIFGNVSGGGVITLASDTVVAFLHVLNTSYDANSSGISGSSVTGTLVTGNGIITYGIEGHGVHLTDSSSNTISGNTLEINGGLAAGINLDSSSDNILTNNIIEARGSHDPSGMYFRADGISLYRSFSNVIYGNTIGANGVGVKIWESDFNYVAENSIIHSYSGVYLSTSSYNTVYHNDITSAQEGVGLLNSSANLISWNHIKTTGYYGSGLSLTNSAFNGIENNDIMADGTDAIGIYILDSYSNSFRSNEITSNWPRAAGVYLTGAAVDLNTGTGNNYSGPGLDCFVDTSVTGTNSIDLCP